jgi:hypothetical protein
MQKIQSYLYPNRVILIADLAGFNVENTIVYQRTTKIYRGVDNVLEFDIQNADQKRLELVTSPTITDLSLNVMDAAGNALPNSPYTITPTSVKGIASVTIPSSDLADLNAQFLKFSVTATKNSNTIPLYCDSRFGAVGTMELVGDATPVTRPDRVYTDFYGEINFMGNVITHTSGIPTKFYEAVPTTNLNVTVELDAFIGDLYVEGTTDMTVSVESFRDSEVPNTRHSFTAPYTGTYTFPTIAVGDLNFIRVSWLYPDVWIFGSQSTAPFGSITKVTVSS